MDQKRKEHIIVFVVFFILSYIIINWDNVSWLFNYKEMDGLAYDFFNPYQDSNLLAVSDDTTTNISNQGAVLVAAAQNVLPAEPKKIYAYSNENNSLEIPIIGLTTPLVIAENIDTSTLAKDLDKGVVYYPGSVLPGENGQIVILGHSAPPNWPHIKHDWVFSNINNLNSGDAIMLHFDGKTYTYRVVEKKIIDQGQDVGSVELSKTDNVLTIISCWPPGKNYKRITVTAALRVNQ